MMLIARALRTFGVAGPNKRQAIALKIAILGREGLDVNDREAKYALKELTGRFSALHLLAGMYVVVQPIEPSMHMGVDFGEKYRGAVALPRE